jgi:hypothetical protein
MRGAGRPTNVHWTRLFLLPLQQLSDEAAQQTFVDITDNAYAKEEIAQILQFMDNMPLAVDLVAYLADYEGLSNILARWEPVKQCKRTMGETARNLPISTLIT